YKSGWIGGHGTVTPAPTAPPTETATGATDTPAAIVTAPTATTAAPANSPSAAPANSASAAPANSASAAPPNSASAAPSTTPSSAATVQTSTDGEGANLPGTRGYVVVESPSPAGVYAMGKFIGLTGQKIEVDCGTKFLRLADPPVPGAAPVVNVV